MKRGASPVRGLVRHFHLSLELNVRSGQALAYGYLVPILFLVAFGSVFRAQTPPLLGQMGQLLTITVLGGACFGMPTALVAERERGIWRRYRLLPVRTGGLVGGVLFARILIVGSAAILQVALAHLFYGTPFPVHPVEALASVILVTACFMGLGLVVAAVADDVPAVQALGQCLFLPMIMIGGVGIPLAALPAWAQRAAGFMPGRYAVDVLQRCYSEREGMSSSGFSIVALVVIGASASVSGARLFRWDSARTLSRRTAIWVAAALAGWITVGLVADYSGRLKPVAPFSSGYAAVTEAQIGAITYENLPGDDEFVSRLSRPFGNGASTRGIEDFAGRLRDWPAGHEADEGQSARNLLCVAAIGDVSEDLHEGEIARLVFDNLRARFGDKRLSRILAWIILYPDEGKTITTAPELGLRHDFREEIIRERVVLYSKKFLGRLRGTIRD